MNDLSKMINDAMNDREVGVNALAREAKRRDLSLSSGTISDYRNGNLPRTIRPETLEAFGILLNIPIQKLIEAAGIAEDPERMSLQESLQGLEPRQQKLIRQLIAELTRSNRAEDEEQPVDEPRKPLALVQDADSQDAGEEQKMKHVAFDRELGDGFQPDSIPED